MTIYNFLWVDPTDLKPGDVVVKLLDRELDGCHCDVMVFVKRDREMDA